MWKKLDLLAVLAQGQLKPIFAEFNLALGPRTTACGVMLALFPQGSYWDTFCAHDFQAQNGKKGILANFSSFFFFFF